MDDMQKLHELQAKGLCCSQVLLGMGLYLRNEKNEQLMQSMGGLCAGLHSGYVCGALSGAACMLSLFDLRLAGQEMIPRLVEWFEDEMLQKYEGINCDDILEYDSNNSSMRCPELMEKTYLKAKEILSVYGFNVHVSDE